MTTCCADRTARPPTPRPGIRLRLPGAAGRLAEAVRQWRERARGRRELAQLSDRALHDIGVRRHDADREARKPFWRK